MKDFYSFIKDYGFKPLTEIVGSVTLIMFCMTLFPSLSWIIKNFVMFIILPWVLAH